MSAFGTKRTSRHTRPMSAFGGKADISRTFRNVCFDPERLVTSSRFVDHLLSCVVNYDGRLEILKLRLASEGGLNSFLKFRSMPQLRSLDAFPIVDGTAPSRRFIKQECFADQVLISPPARYRKTVPSTAAAYDGSAACVVSDYGVSSHGPGDKVPPASSARCR